MKKVSGFLLGTHKKLEKCFFGNDAVLFPVKKRIFGNSG